MKRTMYEAARHTPKDEAGGSNPFKRASGRLPHPSCTPHPVGCVFFCACAEAGIHFVNVFQKQKNSCVSGGSFTFDRRAGRRSPGAGGETAAEKKKREEKRRDRRNAGENSIAFKSLRARQRQAAAPKPHTSLSGACFLLRLH